MNTNYIPNEILTNPHLNNNEKILLNDLFYELNLSGEDDTNSEDYKQLINDINSRIYAEYECEKIRKINKEIRLKLKEAKNTLKNESYLAYKVLNEL